MSLQLRRFTLTLLYVIPVLLAATVQADPPDPSLDLVFGHAEERVSGVAGAASRRHGRVLPALRRRRPWPGAG